MHTHVHRFPTGFVLKILGDYLRLVAVQIINFPRCFDKSSQYLPLNQLGPWHDFRCDFID